MLILAIYVYCFLPRLENFRRLRRLYYYWSQMVNVFMQMHHQLCAAGLAVALLYKYIAALYRLGRACTRQPTPTECQRAQVRPDATRQT